MWDLILAQWIAQGKEPNFDFPEHTSTGIKTLGKNEREPVARWEGSPAVMLPGYASFNHPSCGIQVVLDEYNSKEIFTCSRLLSPAGLVQPNRWIRVSRYDTANDIYSLEVLAFPASKRKFEIVLMNTDRQSEHGIRGYVLPWAHI